VLHIIIGFIKKISPIPDFVKLEALSLVFSEVRDEIFYDIRLLIVKIL